MKRSLLLGRSLAVAPLVLGLALGSSGLAAAATVPALASPAHASTAHAHHAHPAVKHSRKAHHKKIVKRTTHRPGTPGVVAPVAAPAPAPATTVALTPFEARLATLVNQARVAHGLAALTVTAGTTDVARRWALKLAGDDALSHNPAISQDLEAAGSPNWTFLAENVGSTDGGDADGLFAAYMASPHHRANILDPRDVEIGIGAVTAPEPEGDTTFNTMDFVNSYSASYGGAQTNPVAAELPLAGLAAAL